MAGSHCPALVAFTGSQLLRTEALSLSCIVLKQRYPGLSPSASFLSQEVMGKD